MKEARLLIPFFYSRKDGNTIDYSRLVPEHATCWKPSATRNDGADFLLPNLSVKNIFPISTDMKTKLIINMLLKIVQRYSLLTFRQVLLVSPLPATQISVGYGRQVSTVRTSTIGRHTGETIFWERFSESRKWSEPIIVHQINRRGGTFITYLLYVCLSPAHGWVKESSWQRARQSQIQHYVYCTRSLRNLYHLLST
jgi:hypothetical protein